MTKGQIKRAKRNERIIQHHKVKGYSLGQIAKIFKLSRERVRQILQGDFIAVDKKLDIGS